MKYKLVKNNRYKINRQHTRGKNPKIPTSNKTEKVCNRLSNGTSKGANLIPKISTIMNGVETTLSELSLNMNSLRAIKMAQRLVIYILSRIAQ